MLKCLYKYYFSWEHEVQGTPGTIWFEVWSQYHIQNNQILNIYQCFILWTFSISPDINIKTYVLEKYMVLFEVFKGIVSRVNLPSFTPKVQLCHVTLDKWFTLPTPHFSLFWDWIVVIIDIYTLWYLYVPDSILSMSSNFVAYNADNYHMK